MAVDHDKLDSLLKQLPEHLQRIVIEFAESLVAERRASKATDDEFSPSVRTFFGTWDSDENSGDNDRIDADLAHSYSDPHTE
jgi:hypothetical protein